MFNGNMSFSKYLSKLPPFSFDVDALYSIIWGLEVLLLYVVHTTIYQIRPTCSNLLSHTSLVEEENSSKFQLRLVRQCFWQKLFHF